MTRNGREPLLRGLLAAVCTVALIQIALGLAGGAASPGRVTWSRPTSIQDWQRTPVILVFRGFGIHRLLGARREWHRGGAGDRDLQDVGSEVPLKASTQDCVARYYADVTGASSAYGGAALSWNYGGSEPDVRTHQAALQRGTELLLRGIEIRPETRVLNVGCGAGSFAI